ncbi:MAG: hypothetical protein ABI777_13125 [Betaproteobacteria bacterium]
MTVTASHWTARLGAAVALLLALAAGAAVIATIGWRALGPASVTATPTIPADPLPTILASGLWSGAPPVDGAKDGRIAATPRAAGDMRLLGVIAERAGKGFALFRLADGPRLVASGQDVADGLRLIAVRPDGVTVRDGGGERAIALRPESRTAPASTPLVTAAVAPRIAPGRNPACNAPAGFKGPVLRLNAELFQGIVAKPESWMALLAPDRGALVVRDDSSFMAMLAMKKKDRLEQANGIALSAPDDIISAVLKPLAGNQSVRITGTRDGAPREWLLLNAGTCPA